MTQQKQNIFFQFLLQFILQVTTSLILVLVANQWLLIPTVIMTMIFFGLRHIYVRTARCLKRMESMGNNERGLDTHSNHLISTIFIFFLIE